MSSYPLATSAAQGDGGRGVSPWFNLSGMAALFAWTVRRLAKPSRVLSLGLLFLVPTLIVLLGRTQGAGDTTQSSEFYLLFVFVPTAIVPFVALMFSSGLIQDEVEEQTLTYLLIRPMPRAVIYGVKLAAAIALTSLLALVCTSINESVIYMQGVPAGGLMPRALKLVGIYAIALVAYNAIFGLVGLIFRKALPIGVVYIIIFEGFLATIPFMFRKFTVAYYVRSLALGWFSEEEELAKLMSNAWAIGGEAAPGAAECVVTLFTAALVFTIAAAALFTARELRVKTPETT
jgi:ABC-2 type transport system permease protein